MAVPVITYPAELPVSQRKDEIARAIRDHQVVIVAGETGSGKTTQIPKICLELGRGVTGQIGHTQPRRLAARTVAERIAEELGTELGTTVGYKVRFTDTSRRRHAGQGDDRRDPADRAAARPAAAALRHADHRRGARAQPEHRLHPRIRPAAAAEPSRPQGDHHLRDHRPRALQPAFLRRPGRRPRRSHRRGLRAYLSRRGAVPAARRARRRVRRRPGRQSRATRCRASSTPSANCGPTARATSWSSSAANARSATPPTRWPAARTPISRWSRSTPGCHRPSSTGSSSRTGDAGSSWPPTSRRPR